MEKDNKKEELEEVIKEEESLEEVQSEELEEAQAQVQFSDNENVQASLVNETIDEVEKPILDKKALRKQKRLARLRRRYGFEADIKYRGPLSYRYLRILAWMSMAVAMVYQINELSGMLLTNGAVFSGEAASTALSIAGSLSLPLFFIATFATILNRNKSYKSVVIFYLAAYLVIVIGVNFAYYRYVARIVAALSADEETMTNLSLKLSSKAQVNVFSDLLAQSLFFFFLNYTPKKHFQGEKIYIFRCLALVPILVVIVSFVFKTLINLGQVQLPFSVVTMMTTKSPDVYLVFILLAFWLKYRERKYYKLGGTKESYLAFEKTNRNSLAFSFFLSVVLFVISIIEWIVLVVLVAKEDAKGLNYYVAITHGDGLALLFVIPFVLLFSYTRTHAPSSIDLLIVLAGIGMVVFAIVEFGSDVLVLFLTQKPAEEASIAFNFAPVLHSLTGFLRI